MRYLHTMIRIGDIERSVQFYQEVLGFREVRRSDYPEDKFTLIFLQAPGETDSEMGPMLELTYNYGVATYDLGKGYGHMAFQVSSMDELQETVERHGHTFSWGPGSTPDGKKTMAFIVDPDGYQIEFIQYGH